MWRLLLLGAEAADPGPPRADGDVAAVSPHHLVVRIADDVGFSRDPAAWSLDCGAGARPATALSVRTIPIDLVPEGWPYRVVVAHDVVLRFEAALADGTCELGDG